MCMDVRTEGDENYEEPQQDQIRRLQCLVFGVRGGWRAGLCHFSGGGGVTRGDERVFTDG